MRAVWTLAKKELRLLLRDRVAAVLLLGMPLVFILVLGLLLGEGFGQKPDDRLRVSLVDLDAGRGLEPGESWAHVVQRDLAETAGIKVEVIDSLDTARALVGEHKRAAVLVFAPTFSDSVNKCSFLVDGINPFFRDGVKLIDPRLPHETNRVDAELLKDGKQPGAAAIIDQVAQVSLLRVILPWMIGRAFERLSDPEFIQILGNEVNLPVPKKFQFLMGKDKVRLGELLEMASGGNPKDAAMYKGKVGEGVQNALKEQFKKYNLRGKTWAALTKSTDPRENEAAKASAFVNRDGSGLLARGAQRYQVLVPSYTVMFAFFLVLTVGWIFVSERRQGTLKRLRAAPLARWQILLGKLIPCFLLSLSQGLFLLAAGRLLFGLRWGPENWPWWQQIGWLLPVVFCTSLAAMGLALLVAALARSEIQVAIFGAVPVLVLALIGGCVLPREMMPEQTQALTLVTPQGWALDAYRELLGATPEDQPNLGLVLRACGVLAAFGTGFLALAWGLLRLD
jgi:ABC-type multidrug transport system permease subunit